MAYADCWSAPWGCTQTVLRVMELGVGRIRTCDCGVYELGTGSDSPGGVGRSQKPCPRVRTFPEYLAVLLRSKRPLHIRLEAKVPKLDKLQRPRKVSNSHRCSDRCAKSQEPIEFVDPANGLRKYCRNMSANQWLRCLQVDDATAKKF
ncbi:hypothetical protein Pan54_24370 [Rubinisphaera italica]|uniref:Uncharacterized protein n=1 Tax=Rubinisphaera italica TaxID=2527969 RepID=A0A5C5XFD3_9PLAN|nr:hypothetical protein Pan54_24370 [Rubinisphaera italica]